MTEKELDVGIKEEIWKAIEHNRALEIRKEKIIEFYYSQQNINESTKKLWSSDI